MCIRDRSYTLRVIELPDVQPVAENVLNNQSNVISGFPKSSQDKKPTSKPTKIETAEIKVNTSNVLLGYDPNVFIDAVVPVSYTHLDVYKRQLQHRGRGEL